MFQLGLGAGCRMLVASADSSLADHGRSDWLGYWVEFVQKARLKKLACLCHIKQNDLVYPCLPGSKARLNSSLKVSAVDMKCRNFFLQRQP